MYYLHKYIYFLLESDFLFNWFLDNYKNFFKNIKLSTINKLLS